MQVQVMKNVYKMGIYALIGSAVLTSISQVFYANRVQGIHPFLFTCISFFLTAIYFQMVSFKQKVAANWQRSWQPLTKLNIASAITFMGFYFALKYVEPAIVSSLEMGVGPLFILLLMLLQGKMIVRKQWLVAIGTLVACIVLIWAVVNGESGVGVAFSMELLVGIVASICCGIGAVFCSEYSKQLSDIGWTSSMILAKRYIAIIVISTICTYDILVPFFADNIRWIVLVTVVGVLVPNYLLQKGIQYTNTFMVMMSLSFIPVFTFAFQLVDSRIAFSSVTLVGVVILFICGLATLMSDKKISN